jgi:glycosyltransferase involved in cell wall biosynthesis
MPEDHAKRIKNTPDVSFIMPCFNEEDVIGYTIPRLMNAFEYAGYHLELLAVDNGSSDRTGEIIHELATSKYPTIVPYRVEVNEGYGNGVLQAIPKCKARYIGIIPADGQVDAEDVVRLYEAIHAANGKVLAKVRRRFRLDGLRRKIVSVAYNVFVRILWPGLTSWDINGSPKIIPREILATMQLTSKGWFLDPEMLIKAHYLGVRVIEFNVFGRLRGSGVSHVNVNTVWEFFWKLLHYRFSGELSNWKRDIKKTMFQAKTTAS